MKYLYQIDSLSLANVWFFDTVSYCYSVGTVEHYRIWFINVSTIVQQYTSRKHAYIILTPLNPTFI